MLKSEEKLMYQTMPQNSCTVNFKFVLMQGHPSIFLLQLSYSFFRKYSCHNSRSITHVLKNVTNLIFNSIKRKENYFKLLREIKLLLIALFHEAI